MPFSFSCRIIMTLNYVLWTSHSAYTCFFVRKDIFQNLKRITNQTKNMFYSNHSCKFMSAYSYYSVVLCIYYALILVRVWNIMHEFRRVHYVYIKPWLLFRQGTCTTQHYCFIMLTVVYWRALLIVAVTFKCCLASKNNHRKVCSFK